MSLLPMLFSNWWEDLDEPHHVRDQHFGMGVHPEHLITDIFEPRPMHHHHRVTRPHYYRPWGAELLRRNNAGGVSTVNSVKDNFQVVLDVQQFAPKEISVKVVDNYVVVEGNHDEKKDEHGWISRKFTRRYLIPEQCNLENVESKLSSDGILTISVPRKEPPKVEGERVISIQQTGKPAIQEKSEEKNPVEEKK
ncbi:protein lethal(2)essential for life-like [Phymastichus coffea]|uniref:protein lethal(2)essential for life-like n=1 Tax=Phymastichus coffea TaxID=108790 RepID=UPI00273BE5B1|nr:protein lethal(2)essential for life-like [Phymastichus coffea]